VNAPSLAAEQTPPPSISVVDNEDKPDPTLPSSSSPDSGCGCGRIRFRSQAQMVDVMSRILFPCMFLMFNIIYWPYYLFISAP